MSNKAGRPIIQDNLPGELKTILENVLDQDLDDIKPSDDLSTLNVDSVMLLEIMVTLERTYGLKFQQEDLARITSIDDMMTLILEKAPATEATV